MLRRGRLTFLQFSIENGFYSFFSFCFITLVRWKFSLIQSLRLLYCIGKISFADAIKNLHHRIVILAVLESWKTQNYSTFGIFTKMWLGEENRVRLRSINPAASNSLSALETLTVLRPSCSAKEQIVKMTNTNPRSSIQRFFCESVARSSSNT